eukprot:CCRYP_007400-RA/>CCRYP_007400-RA protein AED:0.40 eAED:0.27 QI:0/0/0/1/0.33/0/4/0/700
MEGLANAVQAPAPAQPTQPYTLYQPPNAGQYNTYNPMPGHGYSPQPPQLCPYGSRTYGRTGGGRGHGNCNRQRNNGQYPPPPGPPNQWPPTMHPPQSAQPPPQGFCNRPTHTNPVKYHKNWNYCWSCGFDFSDDDMSGTCPYPKPGHVYHATQDNPCNGCQKGKHKTQMGVNNTNDYAIVDSGASDNYFTPTANVKAKSTLHQPIQVTLPDQSTLQSSHMCELDTPLSKTAKQGYVIPGMKNHSLISVTKMCDAGCKVIFSHDECNIVHNGTIIMQGHKNKQNGLWYIPMKQSITHTYIHQCLFSPTVDTFCKAINNDQLIGFPPITAAQVRRYLPESTATTKGHLRRVRKHTRSTTKQQQAETQAIEYDFRPPINSYVEFELFVGATIADQNEGTIYTDQTGAFPVTSYHSNKYQFVAYEYRSNAILVRALKDQTDKSLIAAFTYVYEYLTDCRFRPKLNVMDNQCSKAVEKYIRSTKATIQRVNPYDHRVNAAELAIQTWKEHWLSGMGTLDPNCPIQLWCQFIEQGQYTLNLLRVSRVNPKLSAYAVLDGQYNFDKTPLAPVGTRAPILIDPSARKTWQSHALDAWYVGPAKNHYRNYRFFIPSTKGYHISGSAKFFPKHTKMPAIEVGDTIRLAAQDLITAIGTMSKAPNTLTPQHTMALHFCNHHKRRQQHSHAAPHITSEGAQSATSSEGEPTK